MQRWRCVNPQDLELSATQNTWFLGRTIDSIEPLCNAKMTGVREAISSYGCWFPLRMIVRDVVSCVDESCGAKAAVLSLSSPVYQGCTKYMPLVAGRRRLSFESNELCLFRDAHCPEHRRFSPSRDPAPSGSSGVRSDCVLRGAPRRACRPRRWGEVEKRQ